MFRKHIKCLAIPPLVTIWGMTGLVVSSACLYIFILLSSELIETKSFLFDQKVIDTVRMYASPAMDRFMLFITETGTILMFGLLLMISMIWLYVKRKDVWGMLFNFLAVAGGGLLNLWLKNYFERERPNVNRIAEADGFSFPSGHSMGSITYYGFLGYLVIRSKYKPLTKLGWGILFGFMILLIGISRIYLGVHYPSDVLAGYMAGIVWLILCISILEMIYFYKNNTFQPAKSAQKKTMVS
ncbi:phosphatase PAP2 family protein [Bacillus sp. B15-48]|uniref:phosphatase PAP2 family protein n=1 Tax=Bacillus sp. B15-48 TaxID=1548601 RepID=UPI00193EED91|nr:phosphatase PAP2 family protein [Bacillus sp. B15-48]MBM4764601.1 phosphatase PAP2 family protein [Bacillus sp. B15-48]